MNAVLWGGGILALSGQDVEDKVEYQDYLISMVKSHSVSCHKSKKNAARLITRLITTGSQHN